MCVILSIVEGRCAAMGELLHENSYGIKMIREDFKKRSQVKVLLEDGAKRYIHRIYRFNRIEAQFDSPYLSWANLDCCGSWAYDEEYLDTAVQMGAKLFADRALSLRAASDQMAKEEALQQFRDFSASLPNGIFADVTGTLDWDGILYTFICREGTIADYLDLKGVFEFYEKLGVFLPPALKAEVTELCGIEIKRYGGKEPPYLFYRSNTDAELVTTGLLLGYPIESTASILCGY